VRKGVDALARPVELEPYIGVGPIKLGMTKEEVQSLFGGKTKSFKKTPDVRVLSDLIEAGVCVHYDDEGRAEAIELATPQEPTLDGRRLLGRPFSEVRAWLQALDLDLEVDASGAESRRVGISLYAPGVNKDPDQPVEGVMVFSRDYYD
jgi:hypothetical protein